MKGRVVVVGDLIDDVIVRPHGPINVDTDTPSTIERSGGGSAANTACWLAASGADVAFVGTVHHDDVAHHRAVLAAAGVDAALHGSDLPTGAIVVISDGSVRTMLTSRGANVETGPESVSDDLLSGAERLHLTGHPLMSPSVESTPRDTEWHALLDRAAAFGVVRSVDPGSAQLLATYGPARFRRLVEGVELLLPNLDEAVLLTGEADPERAARALALDHDLVVITLGPAGALACSGDAVVTASAVPAPPPGPVDVTGAGDAFAAGLLGALAGGLDLPDAMAAANSLASRAVATVGARPR
ncbi:carbohydrate kinase family protein [Nocardioides bigeumensis]|uniref:Carbohydrate kinase PfkB domain-containing protein n=1 Tax=Nocardioides bigeumensis TaxID=433657 RepID=A0ABN2Y3Y6_9ACTN